MWRSLVARRLGEPEAVGSSPAIPTRLGVAQFGSAPGSGLGGQEFKSPHPDFGGTSRQLAPAAVLKTVGVKARRSSTLLSSSKRR
jgi:hypothetical protein